MARFCMDLMISMPIYIRERLEPRFGGKTCELAFRAGIHSGEVYGGYLNGKTRFQLFGETVSTVGMIMNYSRTRRIHVSEATRALLDRAGKGNWVVERDDSVITSFDGRLMRTLACFDGSGVS